MRPPASPIPYPLQGHWYLARNSSNAAGAFLSLITFFILYNNLVPISLYVSMDMIKIFQAKRMEVDRNMRCEEKGVSARARTSDLNEDLGQVRERRCWPVCTPPLAATLPHKLTAPLSPPL